MSLEEDSFDCNDWLNDKTDVWQEECEFTRQELYGIVEQISACVTTIIGIGGIGKTQVALDWIDDRKTASEVVAATWRNRPRLSIWSLVHVLRIASTTLGYRGSKRYEQKIESHRVDKDSHILVSRDIRRDQTLDWEEWLDPLEFIDAQSLQIWPLNPTHHQGHHSDSRPMFEFQDIGLDGDSTDAQGDVEGEDLFTHSEMEREKRKERERARLV